MCHKKIKELKGKRKRKKKPMLQFGFTSTLVVWKHGSTHAFKKLNFLFKINFFSVFGLFFMC